MNYGFWETTTDSYRKNGEAHIKCVCVCGTTRYVREGYLKKGVSKSCGCKRPEFLSKARTTHGRSRNCSTYNTWKSMIQRCFNEKHAAYKNYGGRGVTVIKRWKVFQNFLEDMGERPEGYELDRRNNQKNYMPKNCRWVLRSINLRNTRRSKFWVIDKVTYDSSISAATVLGVTKTTIHRWCNGWTDKRSGTYKPPLPGCYAYLKYTEK